jgi:sec-independent protein translocase protein TatA
MSGFLVCGPMTIAALEGPDLLIVLVILLVLFGGKKLPELARSLGEAKRELEKGANEPTAPPDEPPAG